jgi:hypothetical protein
MIKIKPIFNKKADILGAKNVKAHYFHHCSCVRWKRMG